MKVNVKEFGSFLDKVLMDGTLKIMEIVLDFTDTGIKCAAVDPGSFGKVTGFFSRENFQEYEAIGKIGIMHLEELVGILKKFDKDISLTVEGNVLVIKGEGKKVEAPLGEIELMAEVPEPKGLEFTETMTISAGKLQEFLSDISNDKNDVVITFQTEKSQLILKNEGKYKFTHKLLAEGANGGVKTKMGTPFVGGVSKLKEGELQISFSEMFPIKVMQKTEKSVITLIVAPRVVTEEAEEKSITEEIKEQEE